MVDDNATNRRILRHQLETRRMHVDAASGGEEALRMLRSAVGAGRPYGLALLDVQMPIMDGWALARFIGWKSLFWKFCLSERICSSMKTCTSISLAHSGISSIIGETQ
jgi:Response regulator receiver domain